MVTLAFLGGDHSQYLDTEYMTKIREINADIGTGKDETFHFAFASDDRFALQLQAAVLSLLKSSVGLANVQCIHILDCNISDEVWQIVISRIEDFSRRCCVRCEIVRHEIDMGLFRSFRSWNTSKATYARLLLPRLIPTVRYCVYSDCDMLFFKNPWTLVEELKQAGVAVLGHRNPSPRNINLDAQWFADHGEPYNSLTYFCAGLIAMDLDRFRAPGALEAMMDFLARHHDVVSADQTAMNWYFRNDSALASDGWGLFWMECFGDIPEIAAIHYSGIAPWEAVPSWYEYVMTRRLEEIWIAFVRRTIRVDIGKGRVSTRVRLIGTIANLITHLVLAFHIPIPWKKDYLIEARRVLFRHSALDQAKAKILSGL